MHLYLAFFLHRDYFSLPDASLFCPINDFHDRITKSSKSGGQMPPLRFILSEIFFDAPAYLPPASVPIILPVFLRALFYANFTAVFSAISIISVKLSWRSCAERATGLKR